MRLTLVVPDRPPGSPSGGDRYDAALASALRRRGGDVTVVRARGRWPWPTEEERRELWCALGHDDAPVLIDGLVASSAPDEVEACTSMRPTAVLVHSRLSAGAGATGADAAKLDRREARALGAADVVLATSDFAARELADAYGLDGVVVARPGAEPRPVAPGSAAGGVPQILTLGAVTPVKNHAVLLEALAEVADEPWTAVFAGPAPDPEHLAALRGRAADAGIGDRVTWPGAVVGEDLERLWAATDLLVHPSRSETFGLVVAEAHAHGIPTVVGRGTGAVEALHGTPIPTALASVSPSRTQTPGRPPSTTPAAGPPGEAVATDRPAELAQALRRWLTDPALRRRWRDTALARRGGLAGWDPTAGAVDQVLTDLQTRRTR